MIEDQHGLPPESLLRLLFRWRNERAGARAGVVFALFRGFVSLRVWIAHGLFAAGTQDVNEAAGEAGAQKLSELEEDAAFAAGRARVRLKAMDLVRTFTIQEHHYSYFRVGFRDKSEHVDEYVLLQSLMDRLCSASVL